VGVAGIRLGDSASARFGLSLPGTSKGKGLGSVGRLLAHKALVLLGRKLPRRALGLWGGRLHRAAGIRQGREHDLANHR
jgi:hypothetical protein